jgi:hypothetical protein
VDLSQQYGYAKSSVSQIVDIYPRLKDAKFPMGNFSNHDLRELARVECDAFRYALENAPILAPDARLYGAECRAAAFGGVCACTGGAP